MNPRRRLPRHVAWLAVCTVMVLGGGAPRSQAQARAALPGQFDAYLTKYVELAPDARSQLLGGAPVTKLLDSDPAKEVVDGLSGFVGRLIRGKVRGEAEKGTSAILQVTRTRLESK